MKDVTGVRMISSYSHTFSVSLSKLRPQRESMQLLAQKRWVAATVTKARLSSLCEDQPSPTVGEKSAGWNEVGLETVEALQLSREC